MTFTAGHGKICPPHGRSTWQPADQPTAHQSTWTWYLFEKKKNHTRNPCGSACCGLVCGSPCGSPMWGANFSVACWKSHRLLRNYCISSRDLFTLTPIPLLRIIDSSNWDLFHFLGDGVCIRIAHSFPENPNWSVGLNSQVPKRVVSKRVVLADVPLYRPFFVIFLFFYGLAVRRCLPPQKGETQTKCSAWLEVCCALRISCGWVWSQSQVPGGGGVRREWIMHLELSRAGTTVPCTLRRYGGTAGGTTVPPLYPQEVRRYHPCTLRRYDGATPVPSRGTPVPPLYLEVVRLRNSCPLFILKAHRGRWPLYLVQVQGWYRRTSCRYKGGTVVSARGALSILLHSIHLFCNFIKRPGEAGSSSVASSELTPLRIGGPLHFPILEASSWVTPTTWQLLNAAFTCSFMSSSERTRQDLFPWKGTLAKKKWF